METAPNEAVRDRVRNRYRHNQIQSALRKMFRGKCAYCESKIAHLSDPHIDHYRPKSSFPKLTFDWNNLILACGICNSARYKGDKFPDHNDL